MVASYQALKAHNIYLECLNKKNNPDFPLQASSKFALEVLGGDEIWLVVAARYCVWGWSTTAQVSETSLSPSLTLTAHHAKYEFGWVRSALISRAWNALNSWDLHRITRRHAQDWTSIHALAQTVSNQNIVSNTSYYIDPVTTIPDLMVSCQALSRSARDRNRTTYLWFSAVSDAP